MRLSSENASALYSSAMRRARETASPIASACGLDVQLVPELHERSMGHLSATPWAESRAIYEASHQQWAEGDIDATHPSGESFRQVRDRVMPAFQAIADRHRGETAIIVAHGVVIRVLIASLVESVGLKAIPKITIEHVAIHELRNEGEGWILA